MDTTSKKSVWSYVIAAAIIVVVVVLLLLYRLGNGFSAPSQAAALTVNITNCGSITPQTAAITDGQTIVFDNSDTATHTIYIGRDTINVPAGGRAGLVAKLEYGTGTYGYTCDGKLTTNEITLIPVPGSEAVTQDGLKSIYDGVSASVQACLKVALGPEFDKSYSDVNYVPSTEAIDRVNNCLGSKTSTSTASTVGK